MAKVLTGKVVSTKTQKTITVLVEHTLTHRLYKKVISRNKKYKVHSEDESIVEGDIVRIQETRPLSKDKHFKVIENEAVNNFCKTFRRKALLFIYKQFTLAVPFFVPIIIRTICHE